MAYPQGFEPRLAVLETVVLPLTLRIHIEFVSSSPIVIGTIHPCNKLERDSVRYLGFIQLIRRPVYRSHSSDQSGIEPATFYYTVPSKNTE